jgi:hypothetical protein
MPAVGYEVGQQDHRSNSNKFNLPRFRICFPSTTNISSDTPSITAEEEATVVGAV